MRNALIALVAGGAVAAVAVPALAQAYNPGIATREDSIRYRIDDGVRDGSLSMIEARRLHRELRQIVDLDARYQNDGMDYWQRRDLSSRLSLLDSRLNYDLNMGGGDAGD